MRRLALAAALVLALSPLSPSAFADAVTTRIETRPYYGAIVTIEQGVRVWRALPPHDRIIIAPEGTKLNVNVDASAQRHAPAAPVNTVNINNSGNTTSGFGGYAGSGFVHGGRGPKIMQTGVAPLAGPVKVRPPQYDLRPHQARPVPVKPHH